VERKQNLEPSSKMSPRHKATPVTRRKVKMLAERGMSHERMAEELGITRRQFQIHYAEMLNADPNYARCDPGSARHVPTRESKEFVRQMAIAGVKTEVMAKSLNIAEATLWKSYDDELSSAATKANVNVAMALYEKAINPKLSPATVSAALAWMKWRGGWNAALFPADNEAEGEEKKVDTSKMGKRELAEHAAKTAGLKSEWGDDLHVGAEAIADDKNVVQFSKAH
jgi:CRISPR/Cas system Type II protein with McrA/HNH and RuvC-like nuclease domain